MKMKIAIIFLFASLLAGKALAQLGCTDPLAVNFNTSAIINDGSCLYAPSSVAPLTSNIITSQLIETSGLLWWNNQLWSHNDNADPYVYSIDTVNGNLWQGYNVAGAVNTDWEELAADSNYLYLGDFGNSLNGNRTDLKIFRIEKTSLLAGIPIIDSILFSYPEQVNFSPSGSNNTDFDCEAMVVTNDSIYLFTKQWVTHKTTLYAIPKAPGIYMADSLTTFDVQGLITGAVTFPQKRLTVLCGYSSTLQPFFYLLYDYQSNHYFNGNKRKLDIVLPFHQVEGIAGSDGLKYYFTNENISQGPISVPQQLHTINISAYLSNYLNSITSIHYLNNDNYENIAFHPSGNEIIISGSKLPTKYFIYDVAGKLIEYGTVTTDHQRVSLSLLAKGMYFLKIAGKQYSYCKFIMQ